MTMKEREIIVVMLAKNAREINVARNVVKTKKKTMIFVMHVIVEGENA